MRNKNLKVLSLTLVLLLLLVPTVFAQEETDSFDDIDFSEYDLGDLTEEQEEMLKEELSEIYNSLDEIDREAILSAMESLDIEDGEDADIDSLGQDYQYQHLLHLQYLNFPLQIILPLYQLHLNYYKSHLILLLAFPLVLLLNHLGHIR